MIYLEQLEEDQIAGQDPISILLDYLKKLGKIIKDTFKHPTEKGE